MADSFDNDDIFADAMLNSVRAEPTLSFAEKQQVASIIHQPDFISKLKAGSFGASLGFLIAKFLKLSKTSQILLAIAGFGVGRLILEAENKSPNRFATYNKKTKTYEINNAGN